MEYKNALPAKAAFKNTVGATPTTYANTGVPNTGSVGAKPVVTGTALAATKKPALTGKALAATKKTM